MNLQQKLTLKNVLCIRADNMGDLIMSTPAFRALKETFNCKITVLTSQAGALITPYLEDVDDTISADVPWVKTKHPIGEVQFAYLIQKLSAAAFDAAIVFTVYSQNPLPAAMLSYLSGIPVRVAFCRENPYALLTCWVPDEEPYSLTQHQVERDLKLVNAIGATASSSRLSVFYPEKARTTARQILTHTGVDTSIPFIIFHPGVSELKREYPADLWIEAGKKCLDRGIQQIVITGSVAEQALASQI